MSKAEVARILTEKRAKDGICAKCGKRPIDAERSDRKCTVCLDVLLARDKKRYADGKKHGTSEYAKEAFRLKVKEAGFCIIHTNRKRDGKSKIFCQECSTRKANSQRRFREKNGATVGIRRPHRFKVTHHDGYVRARLGKVAMWGKTEEEAIERLKRKLEQAKATNG